MSLLPTEYDEPINDNQMSQFHLQPHLRATALPATATIFTELPAWPVFMKLEFSRHIFSVPWKSVQCVPCCCTRTDRWTDATKLTVAFCNFIKASKNTNLVATNSWYDNEKKKWGLHGCLKVHSFMVTLTAKMGNPPSLGSHLEPPAFSLHSSGLTDNQKEGLSAWRNSLSDSLSCHACHVVSSAYSCRQYVWLSGGGGGSCHYPMFQETWLADSHEIAETHTHTIGSMALW